MSKKNLYILNPDDNINPFDVTMAADAGFSHILPFPNVQAENVTPMVQDANVALPPKRFNNTCTSSWQIDLFKLIQESKQIAMLDFPEAYEYG